MNPKIVFVFGLLAIAHQATSASLCYFGEGKDICSSSSGRCAPLVVRPANLPKINVESYTKPKVVCQTIGGGVQNPFKPVGDLCSCKQSIVIPAIVPRPVCNVCSSSSSASSSSNSAAASSSCGCGGHRVSGADYGQYLIEESGPTAAVVDPVSLALAYKQQNRGTCGFTEGRLAYGFRKLPIEIVDERASKPEIDEQNIHKLNGEIVELKRIACGPKLSVDDEALAELEAADELDEIEQGEASHIKSLRYKDVGFGVAKVKTVPFREVIGVVEANPQPVEPVRVCADGYKPGNVIFKNTPQTETYSSGPGVPADCGDSDEDYRPYYKYSTSSSSSKSHNSNCKQCAHSKVYY